jgi:hypothetical protein
MRIFGFDFEFCTIVCWLCINNKILGKIFVDSAIMGGATIIPRSLKTTGNENFQDRPNFFKFFKSYMTL